MASFSENNLSGKLDNSSLGSLEEHSNQSWYSLIQNLSYDQLKELKNIFNTKNENGGLSKKDFVNAIDYFYDGDSKYSLQGIILFNEINKNDNKEIFWNDLLDFLEVNLEGKDFKNITIKLHKILCIPHSKKETIIKIVPIETSKYFCYAIISKHGRIGIYDGNLNFLTTYHVIMTKEDIARKEEERRKRNRWITDAIFCSDILIFITTNSARTIMIYEASGLKHVPLWLIISTPNIVTCLAYKAYDYSDNSESVLFLGDDHGQVMSLNFLQSKAGLFKKKHNDKINLFYWMELGKENKEFVKIKKHGLFHKECVRYIKYFNQYLITCSRDCNASVVIKSIENKTKSSTFQIDKGCSCFAFSKLLNILITGSDDGLIRIWNLIITFKPVTILSGHQAGIADIQLLENRKIFFSCSRDGVLKSWDIKEEKCLQSFCITFPSFSVLGKSIEWGINCIYPGPKKTNSVLPPENGHNKINKEINSDNIWDRSNILVTCCNFVANIKTIFLENETEENVDFSILQPPPLQNSVLVPNTWTICNNDNLELDIKEEAKINQISDEYIQKYIKDLKFILEKDVLTEPSDINYKIATLERKKLEMEKYVKNGSAYLALDLYEIEDLRLSTDLPVPNKNKIKHLIEKTETMLENASLKDQLFSESSSSRSRSTRSSIAEFI